MRKINVTEIISNATTKIANTLMLHELKAIWTAIDAKGMVGAIALYERKLTHWTIEDGQRVWAEYKTALDYVKGVDSLFVRIQARACISIVEMTKALAVGLRFIWNQLTLAAVTVATVVKKGLKSLFALIRKGLNGGKALLGRVFRKDDDDIIIEVEAAPIEEEDIPVEEKPAEEKPVKKEEKGGNAPSSSNWGWLTHLDLVDKDALSDNNYDYGLVVVGKTKTMFATIDYDDMWALMSIVFPAVFEQVEKLDKDGHPWLIVFGMGEGWIEFSGEIAGVPCGYLFDTRGNLWDFYNEEADM